MKYRKGYKYQVAEDEVFQTGMLIGKRIKAEFICMDEKGKLTVKSGYAWDGPSGPTKGIVGVLDKIPFIGKWLVKKFLNSFLRGSCGHDALYQLIRNKWLEGIWREAADDYLKQCCLEDKMIKARAAYVHKGVKEFAGFAADPKNIKKVYTAPEVKNVL